MVFFIILFRSLYLYTIWRPRCKGSSFWRISKPINLQKTTSVTMSSADKSDKQEKVFCSDLFLIEYRYDVTETPAQKVKVSFPRNGANVEYIVGKTLGR